MKITAMNSDKFIIILQGGSGSGKTSIANYLEDLGIPKVVTCTTRRPKTGEKHGKDYYFFDQREHFLAEELLEYSEYSGQLYGTGVNEINDKLANFDTICMVLEKEGAKKLKESFPNNVIIISLPITEYDMVQHLAKRGDTGEIIAKRLENSRRLQEAIPWEYADYILAGTDLEKKLKWTRNILQVEGVFKCDICGMISRSVKAVPVEKNLLDCNNSIGLLCEKDRMKYGLK